MRQMGKAAAAGAVSQNAEVSSAGTNRGEKQPWRREGTEMPPSRAYIRLDRYVSARPENGVPPRCV